MIHSRRLENPRNNANSASENNAATTAQHIHIHNNKNNVKQTINTTPYFLKNGYLHKYTWRLRYSQMNEILNIRVVVKKNKRKLQKPKIINVTYSSK